MANDDELTPDDPEDLIPEEPPPSSPDLAIDAPSPPHRGWTIAPKEYVYGALWALYRDREDLRVAKTLAKTGGTSFRTAYTAIHRGWPECGLAPLSERIKLFQRRIVAKRKQELARDNKAADELGKTEARKWKELQDSLWPSVKETATMLAEIRESLARVAKLATLVKYRDVTKIIDKKPVTVSEAYVDGSAHARATFLLVSSLEKLPVIAKAVLGPAAEVREPEIPQFTSDQLAQLQAGIMPEGISYEMLGLALMRGGLQAKGA